MMQSCWHSELLCSNCRRFNFVSL